MALKEKQSSSKMGFSKCSVITKKKKKKIQKENINHSTSNKDCQHWKNKQDYSLREHG